MPNYVLKIFGLYQVQIDGKIILPCEVLRFFSFFLNDVISCHFSYFCSSNHFEEFFGLHLNMA